MKSTTRKPVQVFCIAAILSFMPQTLLAACADSLTYTFASADGYDVFTVTKPVGTSRIDKLGDKQNPALYEFYNVFPAGTLRDEGTYFVSVQAYDRNGASIEGMTLDFTLSC